MPSTFLRRNGQSGSVRHLFLMSLRRRAITDKSSAEQAALETVCAVLLGELALLHDNPPQKLEELAANLRQVARQVSDELGSSAFATTIDEVCELAEESLVTVS
ncbi:hypothetical protein [Aminobacter aminovorans]|uniref:hypothetical protein n=1 Tax=Aminobacter aminovorans TaxID=83263 RepID=UPI001052AD78|nr:hypothetical protein [Aminobacter aminovorans]